MTRPPLKWSYGVTTVPVRFETTLPKTLSSLRNAGFDEPRLFIDGERDPYRYQAHFGIPIERITCRYPVIKAYGNWILALAELFIRVPDANRYAIFQDDVVFAKNLRSYLDRVKLPEDGYWNLYTVPRNQAICPPNHVGFYESNQRGKGALGLVFSREMIVKLLCHQHMVERPMTLPRGEKNIDGAVIETVHAKMGGREWVHNPSLCQHIGLESTLQTGNRPLANSFKGEDWDASTLETPVCSVTL